MEELKDKLIRLRLEKGLKQAQVAKAAGIKQPSYASIEKGDTKNVSLNVAIGIAKALDVPFNELFDIDQPSDFNSTFKSVKGDLARMDKKDRDELDFYRSLFKVLSYFEVLDADLFTKYNPDFSVPFITTISSNLVLAGQFLMKFKENSVDEIQKYVDVEKYQQSAIDSGYPLKFKIIEYIKMAQAKL